MCDVKERPTFVFNFHDKVGQNIAHVEHMEVHFDKDMQMQVEQLLDADAAAMPNDAKSDAGEHALCVALGARDRALLRAAEAEGIIAYHAGRKGYELGKCSTQVLVAYLCGRIFCHDLTDADGCWVEGKRFDDARYCEALFGFDVAVTRRSARSAGAGKSPKGYERVDKLFGK